MMWLNGEILQVYWNGVHHVAAYLGNILVWRENIRTVKATQNIEVTTPVATGTLRLSIPAESYQHLQLSMSRATANARDSKSPTSSTYSNLKASGNAYTRPARFPHGDVPFGISIDLTTAIPALAKKALGIVTEEPNTVGNSISAPSKKANSVDNEGPDIVGNSVSAPSAATNSVDNEGPATAGSSVSAPSKKVNSESTGGPDTVGNSASAPSMATNSESTGGPSVSENSVVSSRPVQPGIGSCIFMIDSQNCVGATSPAQSIKGSILTSLHLEDSEQAVSSISSAVTTEEVCPFKCAAVADVQYIRFGQVGYNVYIYRPKRWKQEGDTVYLDYVEVPWEYPVEDGDYLIIQQVYNATENGDYLEVT